MEPFIIDIDANDEKDFFLSAHEGEEFIMVLKGELEISYGKSNYRLKEGDTIIMIPSYRIMYTQPKDRLHKFWP